MGLPLMPKATAVWLVENTALSFDQIAEFCGMHSLEVQAIADGEVATGMVGLDPIANGQLTQEEIDRCVRDPRARLRLRIQDLPQPVARSKGPRYTPVTKRGDKPDAIAWLLKSHPDLSDAQVCRLIGTTKPTIAAVRERSHWNAANIKPRNPVLLGLCTQRELDEAVSLIRRAPGHHAAEMADMDEEGVGEQGEAGEEESELDHEELVPAEHAQEHGDDFDEDEHEARESV